MLVILFILPAFALQVGCTLTGVAERAGGRGAAFHNVKDALSQMPPPLPPTWIAVSGRIYPSLFPTSPSRNPLNPLTTGLYYCQFCGANIANGQAVSSVLHQQKSQTNLESWYLQQ